MGAGLQRWWSEWEREQEHARYEERTKQPELWCSAPGWNARLLGMFNDDVPVSMKPLGIDAASYEHWRDAPLAAPLPKIGIKDLIFESPPCEQFFKRGPATVALHPSIGDAADAERLAAIINAPLTRDQERRAAELRKTMIVCSTPANRYGYSPFYEALFEGNGLVKMTWDADAVNPNKESTMAQEKRLSEMLGVKPSPMSVKAPTRMCSVCRGAIHTDSLTLNGMYAHVACVEGVMRAENSALDQIDRMRSEGLYLGKSFEAPLHRLMEKLGTGAFSDEQFAQRVEHLLACERRNADASDLIDLAEVAWGVIANASGGDWSKATAEWRDAASRWRDRYHAMLNVRAKQVIEIRDGKCTACGLFTQAGHEPGTCHGQKFEIVRALDAAGFIPKAGLAKILGEPPGELFHMPIPTGEEAIRQGFCFAGGPPLPGEPGRAGDQLRKCHGCDKEQKVDDFNLSIAPHQSVGVFGDAEDLYVCDACAPDVLKAVRRVREGKAQARPEPHDIDLIAGDA